MKPNRYFERFSAEVWIYVTLVAGSFLAWLPLFGRSLPAADDFAFMRLLQARGLSGYVAGFGFWRPLGVYFPIRVFLIDPAYHPVIVLITHIVAVLLLFHLCRLLFGGVKLALSAALIFAIVPFGYEAFTWVIAYNYIISVPFFLANLLLLAAHRKLGWAIPIVFALSAFLSFLTALSNECLLFATAFSGLFVWVMSPKRSLWTSKKTSCLAAAPSLGCAIWLALFYSISGSDIPKHVTTIHLSTILGVYYRQYSLCDIFLPWFSSASRQLIFFNWNVCTFALIVMCVLLFLLGLSRVSTIGRESLEASPTNWFTAVTILALLFGASLIYAVGGGFSLDTRKKYPLVVLLLLLGCWLYRFFVKERRVANHVFFIFGATTCMIGAATAWLMVGIWKHETFCYNALADFITARKIHGLVEVRWNPDLYSAWPQMPRTLGYRFDDTWVLNLAVEYRGGASVIVSPSKDSVLLCYDPKTSGWFIGQK